MIGDGTLIQASLAAGEIAPDTYGRVDLAKYRSGAALLRNYIVDYRGGAFSRPGTQYVARAHASEAVAGVTGRPRLIPFQFKTEQNYMLEFGQQYMRVHMNGAAVLENGFAITGATQANPCVVTAPGNNYAIGDAFYISGINRPGLIELNGGTYLALAVAGDLITLGDLSGRPIDSTIWFTPYVSGGTVARLFTLATPYAAADLPLLKFTQSADVMTLTHPAYQARYLTRTGHAAWTLSIVTFAAAVQIPTGTVATPINYPSGDPALDYYYIVTGETDGPAEESVPTAPFSCSNAALDQTKGVNNSLAFAVPATGPTPVRYNVYKALPVATGQPAPTSFGFIGQTEAAGGGPFSFTDINIAPDFSITAPQHLDPFTGGNDPGCTTYYQQRQAFAGSTADPQTYWLTKPGAFKNMDASNPSVDDDAITATIASRQVNAIKHLVEMPSGLVALTSGDNYLISGGGGAITPATDMAAPQSFGGAADLPPLKIVYDLLYAQELGSSVVATAYNFYSNVYSSTDLSVLAKHLVEEHTVQEWCWAAEPWKVIWGVRDDGVFLSLTYLKEQEVYAWAHSDTDGFFRSTASIPENGAVAVYVVVERYIQGQWLYYIERFWDRRMGGDPTRDLPPDVRRAFCVDCGLAYPLTYPSATIFPPQSLTPSTKTKGLPVFSGTGVFATDAPVTIAAGDILEVNDGVATVTVGCVAGKAFTAVVSRPLLSLYPAAAAAWSATAPVSEVAGLSHLEGRSVAILQDGNVQPPQTVTGGKITLQQAGTRMAIGLGFQCQGQSLPLDAGEPTIQGKRKNINSITVRMVATRGLKLGPDFASLRAFKVRPKPYPTPLELLTGDDRLNVDSTWQEPGQFCWQVDDPLPSKVLAFMPEIGIGDN